MRCPGTSLLFTIIVKMRLKLDASMYSMEIYGWYLLQATCGDEGAKIQSRGSEVSKVWPAEQTIVRIRKGRECGLDFITRDDEIIGSSGPLLPSRAWSFGISDQAPPPRRLLKGKRIQSSTIHTYAYLLL